MATVKIENDNFPDIVVLFMLDYIMSEDMTIENEKWDYFMDKLGGKGVKTELVKYYIATGAVDKSKYKQIKNIFRSKSKGQKSTINIINDMKVDPKSKSSIGSLIKKTLKLIKMHKDRSHGMPLTESKIDDIIQKVIQDAEKEGIL